MKKQINMCLSISMKFILIIIIIIIDINNDELLKKNLKKELKKIKIIPDNL